LLFLLLRMEESALCELLRDYELQQVRQCLLASKVHLVLLIGPYSY
jgi:hypothetical protein